MISQTMDAGSSEYTIHDTVCYHSHVTFGES